MKPSCLIHIHTQTHAHTHSHTKQGNVTLNHSTTMRGKGTHTGRNKHKIKKGPFGKIWPGPGTMSENLDGTRDQIAKRGWDQGTLLPPIQSLSNSHIRKSDNVNFKMV